MKALLLRVGIDKGSGGTYGPIFEDGSFEFVPIPETYRSCTATTYGERIGRKGKPLSTYVPPALRHVPMHDDPSSRRTPTVTLRQNVGLCLSWVKGTCSFFTRD